MNYRMVVTFTIVVMMSLSTMPTAFPQAASQAAIVAYYKDINAVVYDRLRGIYGKDYSYDWDKNKFAFFRNYTTRPASVPADVYSRNALLLDGKLDEDLWKEIRPVVVNLEPTNSWGGAVKKVAVRAINNGTWIFMAFQWEDSTESRDESARVKRPEGGFFYNQTHFYSDNLYVGWWMKDKQQPTVKPWFNPHFAGTTMGRVPWKNDPAARASQWVAKIYWTDDGSKYWPLIYNEPRTFRFGRYVGEPLILPYPSMSETLLNSTANYFIGTGLTFVSGCAFPNKDTFPYDVRASAKWKDGVWTLEAARPFRPHPLNEAVGATMKFQGNELFWVFFGASDGQHGENEEVGSISQWVTVFIEPSPSSTNLPWLFVAVALAAVAGFSGFLVLRRMRHAKRAVPA